VTINCFDDADVAEELFSKLLQIAPLNLRSIAPAPFADQGIIIVTVNFR
jgi:hypothetical protein